MDDNIVKIVLVGAGLTASIIGWVHWKLSNMSDRLIVVEHQAKDCEDDHERLAVLEDRGGVLWRVVESKLAEGFAQKTRR